MTLCSAAGLEEQGAQLYRRYPAKILTGSVCRSHVSILPFEALRLLMSIVIKRCRCLCLRGCSQSILRRKLTRILLVGENFGTLRDDVVQVALSLQTIPSPESVAFHGRCVPFSRKNSSTSETKPASYINARHWADLAEALYQSTTSPFDHLVRLRLESSPISGPQIPGIDLITFRNVHAIIPNILQSRPGDHPITTIGSHESTGGPYTAITGQVTATDGMDGMGELTGYQRVEEAAEYSEDDAVDVGDGEGPDRSKEALIIKRAARRYLLNQSSSDKLKIKRDLCFEACKASADAVHAGYRKIYLGPVPHLLLCLEWIISSVQASKRKIKARRADATLQELSDLASQQTQMR